MSYHNTDLPQLAPTQALFNWRAHLPIHPAAELFPLMSEVELRELAEDIKANGLRAPLVGWGVGGELLLDGRNRLDAMALLGLLYETEDHHVGAKKWVGKQWTDRPGPRLGYEIDFPCLTDGDPYAIALSLNVHRRHLNAEQKRDLIAKVLKAKPELSNRQIAELVKRDDKTVAKVRTELETTAEIPQLEKTTGKDGKARPVKAKKTTLPSAPIETAIDVAAEAKSALAAKLPSEAGATSAVERDWREAERAFEALTAHTVAQVAQVIPPERVALVTEIADYFAALVGVS